MINNNTLYYYDIILYFVCVTYEVCDILFIVIIIVLCAHAVDRTGQTTKTCARISVQNVLSIKSYVKYEGVVWSAGVQRLTIIHRGSPNIGLGTPFSRLCARRFSTRTPKKQYTF